MYEGFHGPLNLDLLMPGGASFSEDLTLNQYTNSGPINPIFNPIHPIFFIISLPLGQGYLRKVPVKVRIRLWHGRTITISKTDKMLP